MEFLILSYAYFGIQLKKVNLAAVALHPIATGSYTT